MGATQSAPQPFSLIRSPDEARLILATAERRDQYLSRCARSPANVAARAKHPYVPTGTREIMPPPVPRQCPRWLIDDLMRDRPAPIPIVVMRATAEGGMPHTRAGVICLPEGHLQAPNATTLYHELIHLHQKNPVTAHRWHAVYKDAFDMEPWLGDLPDILESRRRINPDTVNEPHWIWRGRWVPVPVFINQAAPRLTEMRVYFYDAVAAAEAEPAWQSYPPAEWVDFFGVLDESVQEHPHEMAAYWLSDGRRAPSSAPAVRRFKSAVERWFGRVK